MALKVKRKAPLLSFWEGVADKKRHLSLFPNFRLIRGMTCAHLPSYGLGNGVDSPKSACRLGTQIYSPWLKRGYWVGHHEDCCEGTIPIAHSCRQPRRPTADSRNIEYPRHSVVPICPFFEEVPLESTNRALCSMAAGMCITGLSPT